VVQSVTAAVMPLLAAALYYTALLPAINELDDQQKLGKWLSAKAGSA
jgi:cytochrome c oxidase assembly factor CtaG